MDNKRSPDLKNQVSYDLRPESFKALRKDHREFPSALSEPVDVAIDQFTAAELAFLLDHRYLQPTEVQELDERQTNGVANVILTEEGKDFFSRFLAFARSAEGSQSVSSNPSPTWDSSRRILLYEGKIVKEFVRPATNQETILSAFQEENWRPVILDPLVPRPDTDGKKRLNDAIRSLNRNQRNKCINFKCRGNGKEILWRSVSN